jgi:ATP-dependent Clp protease adapter protein ClpS
MSYRPNRPAPAPAFPRYKVFLHRPADRGLMAVVRAVVDLTHYAAAEAEFRMWEAFHRGRAVVLVTHLERAELYVEQFAARGLPASIEPA